MKSIKTLGSAVLAIVALPLLLLSGAASAAVDITEVTGAKADMALIGAAVFAVVIAIMVYKWAKRAL